LAGRRIAIATICLVPALRVALWMLAPDYRPLIMNSFETSADALAVGCLLALERERLYTIPWLRRVINSRWILPALFLGGVVMSARLRPALLIGIPLQNVAIGLAVERCTRRPEGIFGRFLQWPVLVFIATASYSLYLWQQIFLNRYSAAPWAAFPLNLVLVAFFGLASHFLIERPVLRWRPALERRLFGTARRRGVVPGEAASGPMHLVAVSGAMPRPATGDTLGR
jgi:peptidoglycan/LPS O-acetylase OafA/YrhL